MVTKLFQGAPFGTQTSRYLLNFLLSFDVNEISYGKHASFCKYVKM